MRQAALDSKETAAQCLDYLRKKKIARTRIRSAFSAFRKREKKSVKRFSALNKILPRASLEVN